MVDSQAGMLVTKMLPTDISISLHVEYMKNKSQKDYLAALKLTYKLSARGCDYVTRPLPHIAHKAHSLTMAHSACIADTSDAQ
jgi:hypothetical protein